MDVLKERAKGRGEVVEVILVDRRLKLHSHQVLVVLGEAPSHEHLMAERRARRMIH
jgi:hypothetical protein